jgi:hypothetical protein
MLLHYAAGNGGWPHRCWHRDPSTTLRDSLRESLGFAQDDSVVMVRWVCLQRAGAGGASHQTAEGGCPHMGVCTFAHTILTSGLIAVVGVDVEAEDGVDFDGLGAAGGGAEFPTGQGRHDLGGHGGGAGFEDLEID